MDLGQVFTREVIADYMVSLLSCGKESHILEPCFGGGSFLKACKTAKFVNVDGCEIDKKIYDSTKINYKEYNLFCRDFLSFEPGYKYDGIIMNPPYVRQEKIDDLKELGITKEKLRNNSIYDDLPTTANLYMYFVLKAIELLCDNGELVVIFPSSWMQARSGKSFQKRMLKNTVLINEVHISGDVFEKNALVDVVVFKLLKNIELETSCEPIYLQLEEGNLKKVNRISQDMKLSLDMPFGTYSSVRRGLTTGWNSMFINPNLVSRVNQRYLHKIISTPKAVTGYNTDSAETDNLLIIKSGEPLNVEMKEYIKGFEERLSKEKKPKALYEKVKQSKEWYTLNYVNSDGILFSYFVRNDMKFVMNTTNTIARDNFYIIYPRIDKYLMFALLNNYYTYYQLESTGKHYGAGLLKLQRYDIENLKFIDVNMLDKNDISELTNLAHVLVEKSDKSTIYDITRILARYTNTHYECIAEAYECKKRQRLEVS